MGRFPPGLPLIPGFLWDFGIHPRVLLVPPRANRGQGLGPQPLRISTFSTLGSLHVRGPSNRLVQEPDAPLRDRWRLPHDRNEWTKQPVSMAGGSFSRRRSSLAHGSSPYLSPLRRRERLLQGRFTEQNGY